jgi:cytochrome b
MNEPQVKVWDPLVRLFHWSLPVAFVVAYLTQEQAYDTHLAAGYTILGLVLVRLVWGFIGTRHARFGDFVRGPRAVVGYLKALAAGRAPRYLGHNPAGGAMILALIATLLVIALSGIALDAAENRAGPLGGTQLFLYLDPIMTVHAWSSDLALVLIAVHVLAVIHASRALGENLVRAMITGRKPGRLTSGVA